MCQSGIRAPAAAACRACTAPSGRRHRSSVITVAAAAPPSPGEAAAARRPPYNRVGTTGAGSGGLWFAGNTALGIHRLRDATIGRPEVRRARHAVARRLDRPPGRRRARCHPPSRRTMRVRPGNSPAGPVLFVRPDGRAWIDPGRLAAGVELGGRHLESTRRLRPVADVVPARALTRLREEGTCYTAGSWRRCCRADDAPGNGQCNAASSDVTASMRSTRAQPSQYPHRPGRSPGRSAAPPNQRFDTSERRRSFSARCLNAVSAR